MALSFSSFDRLPTIPAIAVQILQAYADPDASLTDVVRIVAPDPALSAKLLRAANSVQYGAGAPINSLVRAVAVLGRSQVASLVLCFSLAEQSFNDRQLSRLYRRVWLQAVVQAIAAGLLGKRQTPRMDAEFFLAGVLGQIGELALLKGAPDEYASFVESKDSLMERSLVTVPLIQGTIDELTEELLRRWGLPEQFPGAIRRRWELVEQLAGPAPGPAGRLAQALAFATAAGAYLCEGEKGPSLLRLSVLGSELFQLPPADLPSFLADLQVEVRENSRLFDMDVSSIGTPAELMDLAMQELARIARDEDPERCRHRSLTQESDLVKQRLVQLLGTAPHSSIETPFTRPPSKTTTTGNG